MYTLYIVGIHYIISIQSIYHLQISEVEFILYSKLIVVLQKYNWLIIDFLKTWSQLSVCNSNDLNQTFVIGKMAPSSTIQPNG